MLTDSQCLLVARAVDGGLSPADQAAFRTLASESREALSLFQSLQSQHARLQALPRPPLPAVRSEGLIRAIRQAPAPIAPAVTVRGPARPVRSLLPYAVAASTLLAVTAASFWTALQSPRPQTDSFAKTATTSNTRKEGPVDPTAPAPLVNDPAAPSDRQPAPAAVRPEVARADADAELAPEPTPVRPRSDLIGSEAFPQRAALAALEIRIPVLTTVSKLDSPALRGHLLSEFDSSQTVRLDLFCRDTLRGIEALQAAATASGIAFSVDALTAERIKRSMPLTWAVYTESMTSDDFSKCLALLAMTNRRAGSDAAFGAAHLSPAGATDIRDLRELFGIDANFAKRPATPAINSATADRIASNLTKPAKTGVVTTYAPTAARTPATTSAEVRAFLASRGDRKPGTTAVIVVVRPTN